MLLLDIFFINLFIDSKTFFLIRQRCLRDAKLVNPANSMHGFLLGLLNLKFKRPGIGMDTPAV